jgi:uncharacterized protein (DUF924 family)
MRTLVRRFRTFPHREGILTVYEVDNLRFKIPLHGVTEY